MGLARLNVGSPPLVPPFGHIALRLALEAPEPTGTPANGEATLMVAAVEGAEGAHAVPLRDRTAGVQFRYRERRRFDAGVTAHRCVTSRITPTSGRKMSESTPVSP